MQFQDCAMARRRLLSSAIGLFVVAGVGHAQPLSGEALVKALRQGGYVIVMRHASSPREAPDRQTANADNVNRERQLDATGRAGATVMGKAIRELRIPIGEVLTSPTYRALETVRLAQFRNPRTVVELGDGGQSMQEVSEAQAEWLRKKVAEAPTGTNTLLVTHFPNISRAFPQWSSGLADGEALAIASDGNAGTKLVARIKIEEWPRLGL
jgi:phosphohistidine phosphatase SixA